MKTCYCCKETKPFEMFGKNKHKKDGLATECKPCKSASDARYRAAQGDALKERKKEQYHQSRDKHQRLTWAEWSKLRKENAVGDQILKNIHNSKRRRQMEKQEVSELDELVMIEAHSLAALRTQKTGVKWHVDHIVPLFHKEACGLNNAFNLQVVPAKWNISKSNKSMAEYWPQG